MKKLLILASAFVFAASTTVLMAQNPKVNKQVKNSTAAVKDEAQKAAVKDESKTIALERKTNQPQKVKKMPPNPQDKKIMKESAKKEKIAEKRVDPVHNPANKMKESKVETHEKK